MARANAVVPHIFRHLLAVTLLGNDVSESAAMALKMKSDESGAGRFHDFALPPLTFNELMPHSHLPLFYAKC